MINYKLTYKTSYVEEIVDDKQYFDMGLISLPEDVTFIDAGSYIGDSLEEFWDYTKGSYKRVICLEPIEANVKALTRLINEKAFENVDVYQLGASDHRHTLYFDSQNGMAARATENGKERIECDSIDNICAVGKYEKIDFIKMDIEGAECAALRGAEDVIKRDKPILAICVYHKEDDFYTIPNLIKEIYPEYRIYFRHYELSDEETVCYAIADD